MTPPESPLERTLGALFYSSRHASVADVAENILDALVVDGDGRGVADVLQQGFDAIATALDNIAEAIRGRDAS